MRILLILIMSWVVTSVAAQGVYPHQFTEKTTLTDSDWEVYSQKSGLPRRISPLTLSAYFLKGVRAYQVGDIVYFSRRDSVSSVNLAAYKQTLSVSTNGSGQTQITISNGNTITLPAASVGGIEVESPLEGTGSSGDPLGVANGGIGTSKIADEAVTLAKIQTIPTQTLLGRYGAGTGAIQTVTIGPGLALSPGGQLSATGSGGSGGGIYSGSGTLPNDTVKVTNTAHIKLKDAANNNGTLFFNKTKSTYLFIPDAVTDSLNQGFLIKRGVDSAAVAIDKDGQLQILSDNWVVIGNKQAKIIVRDNDGGVTFRFGNDDYTFPNQEPSGFQSMGTSNKIMSFSSGGTGVWVDFDVEVRARLKRDTFITVPHSTNYTADLAITNPARFYNNIHLSCKGRTDTTIVAFLAAPNPSSEFKGVTYQVKNDSGLVGVLINALYRHNGNSKTFYLLKKGQTLQVKALPDAVTGTYMWASTLTWDSIATSSGATILEYNVAVTGANSGSNLRVIATATGVTASYASNKITVVIPSGVRVLSADWRLVSADIQSSADAGGVTNWVQAEFQGTGGNTGVTDLRIPVVQKTSIPTSGALSVTNSASIDIDNNPAVTVVGATSGSITLRVGGISSGSQGYHLKFSQL